MFVEMPNIAADIVGGVSMGTLRRTGGQPVSQKRKADQAGIGDKDESDPEENEQNGPAEKKVNVPVISKNDFFAYADGKREVDQTWNLPGMFIVLKGEVQGITAPGDASRNTRTYFSSNHMLTFKGGKRWVNAQAPAKGSADAKTNIEDKASNILRKRQLKGYNRPQNVTEKYGSTTNKNAKQRARAPGNTFIICDQLTKSDLQAIFVAAINGAIRRTGSRVNVEAYLDLSAYTEAVLKVERNGSRSYLTGCTINFDYIRTSPTSISVLVKHLKG